MSDFDVEAYRADPRYNEGNKAPLVRGELPGASFDWPEGTFDELTAKAAEDRANHEQTLAKYRSQNWFRRLARWIGHEWGGLPKRRRYQRTEQGWAHPSPLGEDYE